MEKNWLLGALWVRLGHLCGEKSHVVYPFSVKFFFFKKQICFEYIFKGLRPTAGQGPKQRACCSRGSVLVLVVVVVARVAVVVGVVSAVVVVVVVVGGSGGSLLLLLLSWPSLGRCWRILGAIWASWELC